MSPLEMLFRLEVEFHRELRAAVAHGTGDDGSLHTSYALQSGYDQLLTAIPVVSDRQIEQLVERFVRAGDPRDVFAAGESVKQLLGLCLADA
jgi:hypothetical protein